MFRCDFCLMSSKPGEKLRLIPTETRERIYRDVQREFRGSEIVVESKQCARCASGVTVANVSPPTNISV